jgi:hypothetical protein
MIPRPRAPCVPFALAHPTASLFCPETPGFARDKFPVSSLREPSKGRFAAVALAFEGRFQMFDRLARDLAEADEPASTYGFHYLVTCLRGFGGRSPPAS